MITLGMKLKSLRKQHGMDQNAVASYLNVQRQSVSMWERDMNKATNENLEKLAKLFNVSLSYLKYEEDNIGALLEYRLQEEFNIGELGEWEKKYLVEKIIKIYDIIR